MACRACGLDHAPLIRCEVAKRQAVINGVVNDNVVNTPVVTDEVTDDEVNPVVNASRQVLWQQANRERYNARMREYMRKRRGDVKADR
jgi:hypothetical protein